MEDREVSSADRACLDDRLRFFSWKWAGFWRWLDSIGKNTQPVPMPPASDGREATKSRTRRHGSNSRSRTSSPPPRNDASP